MNQRILRYIIKEPNSTCDGAFENEIEIHKGAKIISCGLGVDGKVSIWAEADWNNASELKIIYTVGTGHGVVPMDGRFIGTVISAPYVWHLYEKMNITLA
jgi:hypothetical protein